MRSALPQPFPPPVQGLPSLQMPVDCVHNHAYKTTDILYRTVLIKHCCWKNKDSQPFFKGTRRIPIRWKINITSPSRNKVYTWFPLSKSNNNSQLRSRLLQSGFSMSFINKTMKAKDTETEHDQHPHKTHSSGLKSCTVLLPWCHALGNLHF